MSSLACQKLWLSSSQLLGVMKMLAYQDVVALWTLFRCGGLSVPLVIWTEWRKERSHSLRLPLNEWLISIDIFWGFMDHILDRGMIRRLSSATPQCARSHRVGLVRFLEVLFWERTDSLFGRYVSNLQQWIFALADFYLSLYTTGSRKCQRILLLEFREC